MGFDDPEEDMEWMLHQAEEDDSSSCARATAAPPAVGGEEDMLTYQQEHTPRRQPAHISSAEYKCTPPPPAKESGVITRDTPVSSSKRLRRKTTVSNITINGTDHAPETSREHGLSPPETPTPLLPQKMWPARTTVLGIMREVYWKRWQEGAAEGAGKEDMAHLAKKTQQRDAVRKKFARLPDGAKLALLREVAAQGAFEAPPLQEAVEAMTRDWGGEPGQIASTAEEHPIYKYRGSGTMFTFHGEWSRIHCPICEGILNDYQKASSTTRCQQTAVEAVSTRLKEHEGVRKLWLDFQSYVRDLLASKDVRRHTIALELHNEKSLESGQVWVHTHLMFDCLGRTITLTRSRHIMFKGTFPHTSLDCVKARGRAVKKAFDQGHYYLSVSKLGGIMNQSTVQPNASYAVNPEWVTAWWQQNKISSSTARLEYIQCKRHVQKYLDNLDYQQKAERASRLEALKRQADQDTERLMKRPRRLATVEEHFIAQFAEPLLRRKFLVLDGPSRTGKTLFAYSLAGAKCTLDVNCSRTMEPNLKTFDPVVHKTILFDEAKASMVVEHKALFQGRNAWVDMATSGTNCYSYKVWAYGTMMVVASNKWQQELDAMPTVDSAWLRENSVYVNVTEPLWVAGEDGHV